MGSGAYIAFIIWMLISILFFVFGIYIWHAKKKVTLWTFRENFAVSDVKKFNRAVAKAWFAYAVIFALLGMPLQYGQNSAWAIIPILGCMFASIALMVVYTRIEKKYRI